MDLSTRKEDFIQRYRGIKDEALLARFERLLAEAEAEELAREAASPMSEERLNAEVDVAERQYTHGHCTDIMDMEKEKWA